MTWKSLLKYCIGEVGIRPDDFWNLTFAEIDAICEGYEIRRAKEDRIPREIVGSIVNLFSKRPIDIRKYIPLYIDKIRGIALMSSDEFDKALKLMGYKRPTERDKKRLLNGK